MKYPNARIIDFGAKCYVVLQEPIYLALDRREHLFDKSKSSKDNYSKIEFKSKTEAQNALDKYNMKKEITLSEIKSQYEVAKKLIGKTVKRLEDGEIHKVASVQLAFTEEDVKEKLLPKERAIFDKLGYLIIMWDKNTGFGTIFAEGHYKILESVIVINHNGKPYTSEDAGDCWGFGCAFISKDLIRQAYKLMDSATEGNRSVKKITIGAADFDKETLKKLVDLD